MIACVLCHVSVPLNRGTNLQHSHIQEPLIPTYVFILVLSPPVGWNPLLSLTRQRNPVLQRSFWKNHHKGVDLLRQRKNCPTAAEAVSGVTRFLDVSGQGHRLPDIKSSAHVRAPRLTPSAHKAWSLRNQGANNIWAQFRFSCHSLHKLFCFSFLV